MRYQQFPASTAASCGRSAVVSVIFSAEYFSAPGRLENENVVDRWDAPRQVGALGFSAAGADDGITKSMTALGGGLPAFAAMLWSALP